MDNKVLNVLINFTNKYELSDLTDMLNTITDETSKEESITTVKNVLDGICEYAMKSIKDGSMDNDEYVYLLDSLKEVFDAMDSKKRYLLKTDKLISLADAVIKSNTENKALAVVEDESNPELDKKISVNGKKFATAVGIVVVCGAIMACATKCSNKPIANNDSKTLNNDIQKEDTIKPGISTPSNNEPVVNNTEQEELSDLEVATLKTYENWSNITDKYTVDDVREVVKALNGLESSITIEEADDVLTDVIEMVIFPKFNSMSGIEEFNLIGLKAQPKVLNLNTLYIDKEMTRVDNYLNSQVGMMNSVMNGLILGEKELDYAKASLTLELDVLANGKLDNATPIEKILFSRMAVYTNVLAAPLTPSDAYDNLSSSLNELANEAMKGLNK